MAPSRARWLLPFLYCISLCLAPLLLSKVHSFWMDEGYTWRVTRAASFPGLLAAMLDITKSGLATAQSPGHLIYAWGWAQLGDQSEEWSRWSNVPWMALLGFAWWRLAALAFARRWQARSVFLALPVVSPFVVWYSMEYRPYAALIALGAVALVGQVTALRGDARGRWVTVLSVVVAAYFHLLALVLVPCVVTVLLIRRRGRLTDVLREWKRELLVGTLLSTPVLAYYAYTLAVGLRSFVASASGLNLAFILYEFLGFSGLGPSRHELHLDASLVPFLDWLPALALLALPLALLLYRGVRRPSADEAQPMQDPLRTILFVALIWGVGGVALLLVAALFSEFRILGRHVGVLYPAFLGAIGILISWRPIGRVWQWSMIALLLVMQATSAARLIGTERHARDDYRAAARLAREYREPGELVVVMAGLTAYGYYDAQVHEYATGLDELASTPRPTGFVLFSPTYAEWKSLLDSWDGPILLVLGKRYFFDARGTVGEWLSEHADHRLLAAPPTFELWRIDRRAGER